ncbi:MAG: hypothetical protein Q9198_002183 [Flavoplaca austrocitrina]
MLALMAPPTSGGIVPSGKGYHLPRSSRFLHRISVAKALLTTSVYDERTPTIGRAYWTGMKVPATTAKHGRKWEDAVTDAKDSCRRKDPPSHTQGTEHKLRPRRLCSNSLSIRKQGPLSPPPDWPLPELPQPDRHRLRPALRVGDSAVTPSESAKLWGLVFAGGLASEENVA